MCARVTTCYGCYGSPWELGNDSWGLAASTKRSVETSNVGMISYDFMTFLQCCCFSDDYRKNTQTQHFPAHQRLENRGQHLQISGTSQVLQFLTSQASTNGTGEHTHNA